MPYNQESVILLIIVILYLSVDLKENLIVFCKYEQILSLMAATHSKKVVTETCLPLCHFTFPF